MLTQWTITMRQWLYLVVGCSSSTASRNMAVILPKMRTSVWTLTRWLKGHFSVGWLQTHMLWAMAHGTGAMKYPCTDTLDVPSWEFPLYTWCNVWPRFRTRSHSLFISSAFSGLWLIGPNGFQFFSKPTAKVAHHHEHVNCQCQAIHQGKNSACYCGLVQNSRWFVSLQMV